MCLTRILFAVKVNAAQYYGLDHNRKLQWIPVSYSVAGRHKQLFVCFLPHSLWSKTRTLLSVALLLTVCSNLPSLLGRIFREIYPKGFWTLKSYSFNKNNIRIDINVSLKQHLIHGISISCNSKF